MKLSPLAEGSYYDEMERIFHLMLNIKVTNVVIVLPESDDVNLVYTYYPFTPYSCYETFPVLKVRYVDGVADREVDFDTIFPEKISNIHGCQVTVALFNSTPYITVDPVKQELSDFEGVLLEELSKNMNFSIRFNLRKVGEESRGTVFDNGTANGALLKVRLTFITHFIYQYLTAYEIGSEYVIGMLQVFSRTSCCDQLN